jgi:hypothetical protein
VFQYLRIHEASEPIRKNIGRNAERLSKRAETTDPAKRRDQH